MVAKQDSTHKQYNNNQIFKIKSKHKNTNNILKILQIKE